NHTTPVLLMGYANPFLQFGWERLLDRAATAGASGFIIPDLPPEESLSLQSDMSAHGMDLIYLVAPNSGEERIAWIDRISQGFVYAVSVTGVTGARDHLAPEVIRYLELLKSKLRHPVLVGFGVSGPEAAVRLAAHCDGVIIGSAVIQCIEKARDLHQAREQVFDFVSGIRQALNSMKRK
ncbi:MAG: tryptophan synthase subunit alpha, partial [Calditrichaeota bacterium]